MAEWDLDLLGDPVPPGFGRRGRPQHVPTLENRRKVMVLAAFDRNEEQIAAALSITPPTLRKHYFRELRARLEARQRLEAKLLMSLVTEAEEGNVSAIEKLFKRLDKHDTKILSDRVANRGQAETKKAKLGKKELQRQAAGEVSGKFAPPEAPKLLN